MHDEQLQVDRTLRATLADVLGLAPERVAAFHEATGLFGHLPELDSMAVAGLLTEIEDRLGITIDDDEVSADTLETYGALLLFAQRKALSWGRQDQDPRSTTPAG